MSEKRELPAELKAIEAELASLVPRTDELDRERLIFMAGQASAQKATMLPGAFLGRMAWPAATATMTAVAASLLVILVMQSEPETKTRVVYRYIERPKTVEPGSTQQVESEDLLPEILPVEPDPADDSTLSWALAWIDFPDRQRVRLEARYFRQLDRMLEDRFNPPADVFPESTLRQPSRDTNRADAPVTYRWLLDSLIETPGSNARQPDSSATEAPRSSGVNS